MNVLRTFATAVFICMIFYGILMHFVPNGAMSSSFKTTVSIALIASVIVSAGAAMKFDIGDIKYSGKRAAIGDYASYAADYENETVKSTTASVINERLKNAGIDNAYTSVFTDISADGGISITEAVVYCDTDDLTAAQNAVGDLGFTISYKGK